MNTNEVKQYLEKELPNFEYKTNPNEGNEHKLWIERDGQHIILDVQKVVDEKGAKKLKEFIELKWRQLEQ